MRRPASQFYWGDWLNCQEVRAVSLAARGLWMDMLCYMRQGEPVGHLTHHDGRPISPAQLARTVGESVRVVERLLAELERAGVPGKAENGAYTSRRMLRDEQEYQRYRAGQAEAGKRGAAERWGSPSPPYPDPMKNTWGQHGSSSSSSSSKKGETEASLARGGKRADQGHSSEPPAASEPALLVFPTVGSGGTQWPLSAQQVVEWRGLFPSLDILAEAKKALAWVRANPGRRKTTKGMSTFLVNWFNRTSDRGGSNGSQRSAAVPRRIAGSTLQDAPIDKYAGITHGLDRHDDE